MKTLNRIIIIALFCFSSSHLTAQIFSLTGGLNIANMLSKDKNNTYSESFNNNLGFHAGAKLELPITKSVAFETGLIFSNKGYKKENEAFYEKQTIDLDLYYLDLPLLIKVNTNLGDNVILSGLTGPYIGYGLFGKTKVEITYQDEKYSDELKIVWGDDLNRFDAGLTFGGELVINSILLGASFDLGLINIYPDSNNGSTLKNRVLKFSAGYKFN